MEKKDIIQLLKNKRFNVYDDNNVVTVKERDYSRYDEFKQILKENNYNCSYGMVIEYEEVENNGQTEAEDNGQRL